MATQDDNQAIPVHVGLILDGNRRWAAEHNLPKLEGHRRGYDNLKNIAEHMFDNGVKFVSAYIFSTENWNRTQEEVSYLMKLAYRMVRRDAAELHKKNIRLVWLGSEDRVDQKITKAIRDAEELTKDNTGGTLCLCFNYGGHREILDAASSLLDKKNISEKDFENALYAGAIVPGVDLLIRTSGEQRLSGFMLWRAAYAELLFIKKHWPDFSPQDANDALAEYSSRHRRYGA